MKKFIIMSLTSLFALSLAGCGKGKKDCDEGQVLKDGECVAESSGDAGDDAKVVLYLSNENDKKLTAQSGTASAEAAKNECVAVKKSEVSALKASLEGVTDAVCDSSSADKKCPESGNHKVNAEGKLEKADKAPADTSKCKALAKPVADYFTVSRFLTGTTVVVKVEVGDKSVNLESGLGASASASGLGCVKVKKSEVAKLKITKGDDVVCNNKDADTANNCVADNLEIKAKADDANAAEAVKAASANAKCTAVLAVPPPATS